MVGLKYFKPIICTHIVGLMFIYSVHKYEMVGLKYTEITKKEGDKAG